MELDPNLISQFAKLTKDNSKSRREVILFGTIVEEDDSLYVRLDGSDLLTPMVTTVEVKPGERVTVMLKNHSATVTGNISSPAARSATVSDALTGVPTNDKVDTLTRKVNTLTTEVNSVKTRLNTAETNITTLSNKIDVLVKMHSAKTIVTKSDSSFNAKVISGSQTIQTLASLKAIFGDSARLQWHYQSTTDSTMDYISPSDARLTNNGFTLTPAEADTNRIFRYDVII